MKVTVEISEMQLLKSVALATEAINEQNAEKILCAARETPEIDLTEILQSEPDFKDMRLAIGIVAVGAIAKKLGL